MNDEQVLQLVDSLFHEFASSYRSEARQRAVEKLTAYNKQKPSAAQIAAEMTTVIANIESIDPNDIAAYLREWVRQLRLL